MPDNKKPLVLVVDDSEANVLILEEILKDEYEVLTAESACEALEVLGDAQMLPKIILLDYIMPGMSGREMFEAMKENDKLSRIPVIFITGEENSEIELLGIGAVDFIKKPFANEIVKLRVRNQISLKNYSDNLEELVEEKTAEATNTLDNALQALANTIEHRDSDSGQHVKRTQLFVKALVDYLIETESIYAEELKTHQPETIMKAMALHDVGKIAIPDRILLKPGKLTDDEYEIMKTHTIKGKEVIDEFGDVKSSLYLTHCADICYAHHERWDGKGYPRQLKENEIPLTARIASVADVYDALVSARVYKAAMPYDQAFGIISSGSGTHFDPVIADAALKIKDKFIKISEDHK